MILRAENFYAHSLLKTLEWKKKKNLLAILQESTVGFSVIRQRDSEGEVRMLTISFMRQRTPHQLGEERLISGLVAENDRDSGSSANGN